MHTLHYITLHYITLHYITLHYITLHYITLHYITLHTDRQTYIHTYNNNNNNNSNSYNDTTTKYNTISVVNRGQREQKGSFREHPKAKCVLVEYRGSFRGYPINYPP